MEQEHFWLSGATEPAFPLKCVACTATYDGNIDKAIDDGWNFCVYGTSQGMVQFAGCPLHGTEYEAKSFAFLKSKIGRMYDDEKG